MKREIRTCPVNQWRSFVQAVQSDRWEISGIVLAWLPSLLLTAPVVGYLWELLRLPFGWVTWALIALLSIALTLPLRRFFRVDSWGELIGLTILLAAIALCYSCASVSFDQSSPSTAVWYKALNLIDGGHLYRAMPWLKSFIGAGAAPASVYEQYGALVADAQYTHGNLHFMGLPGGAWFFAWWGMITRPLLFIAPLMLMLGTGIVLNRLLRQALPQGHWAARLLLALSLVATPVYLYFGRGMYLALYALPCYGIALLLLMQKEWDRGPYGTLLIASVALPILCGTDFILPFFAAVLLLTWRRPAWGLSLGITGALAFYGLQAAEPLWFGQVIGMPVWVRGIVYFLFGFYVIGLILYRFVSEETAEKWCHSRWITALFYAALLAAAVFLFKKSGAMSGFGALSLAFSGVMLLGGLLAFPAVLKQKNWPLIARLMAAGLFLSQLIFFRERPIYSLYTDYQPYVALLLPLLWLSFGLWAVRAKGWPRYLVLGALLVSVSAQSWGAQLIPQERTAREDLIAFARQCEAAGAGEDTAIAYYPAQEQAQTPLVWYCGLTPAPMVQGTEIGIVDAVADDWLVITSRPMESYQAQAALGYTALSPRQDGLPEPHLTETSWILLDRDDILQEISDTGSLFPSLTWRAEGGGTAYTDHIRVFGISVPLDDNRYLLIEGAGDDAAGFMEKGLEAYVEGLPLSYEGQGGNVYCFALPDDLSELTSVDLYIDPLPGDAYTEGTVWETGLDIAAIRLTRQVPDGIQGESIDAD
jgi:hypothetical protein